MAAIFSFANYILLYPYRVWLVSEMAGIELESVCLFSCYHKKHAADAKQINTLKELAHLQHSLTDLVSRLG